MPRSVADVEENRKEEPVLKTHLEGAQEEDGDALLLSGPERRSDFVDMTRIVCVWVVVQEHGDWDYGLWNVMLGQSWTLQFLMIVCGVCFCMSKRSLWGYQSRLALYLVVGVLVNWTAWLIKGKDWRGDFFDVVFQFWFVVDIMIYSLMLNPLKLFLQNLPQSAEKHSAMQEASYEMCEEPISISNDDEGQGTRRTHDGSWLTWLRSLALLACGMSIICLVFQFAITPVLQEVLAPPIYKAVLRMGDGARWWGLPTTLEASDTFVAEQCFYLLGFVLSLFLVMAGSQLFAHSGTVTWLVLLNIYGNRCLFYRSKSERTMHGMELMMLGMTCYHLGLRYRRTVGQYVIRYWFLVLFALVMLWPLGLRQRLDENPPAQNQVEYRVRFQLMEAICVVCWIAAGDRAVQPEIFSKDKLGFLNDWALLLFLIHMAIHTVFPPPWNWIILVALAPLCFLVRQCRQ